jgi:hypothetical protein
MTIGTKGNRQVNNIQNNPIEPFSIMDGHLSDMERRVNAISQHSKDIEQKAYAFDCTRQQIFGTCSEGLDFIYKIAVERCGGAVKTLILGHQETNTKEA